MTFVRIRSQELQKEVMQAALEVLAMPVVLEEGVMLGVLEDLALEVGEVQEELVAPEVPAVLGEALAARVPVTMKEDLKEILHRFRPFHRLRLTRSWRL